MPDPIDGDILGTTEQINVQGAQGLGASQGASVGNEAEALSDEQSDIEAEVFGDQPVNTSGRKRRQSPEVAERERLRTAAVQERLRAATARADAAQAAASKGVSQARRAEILATRTEFPQARSGDVWDMENAAFSEFASGYSGNSAEMESAWQEKRLQSGLMSDAEQFRYRKQQFQARLPGEESAATGIDREARLSFLESWGGGYSGSRDDIAAERRKALVSAGFATGSEREQVVVDDLRARLPAKEETHSLKELLTSLDMGYAVGYGSMSTFQGVSNAWKPWASGDAYLMGQAQEQTGTSFLPLAGAVGGTLLGSRFGLGGMMAGQFAGQSIGQAGQDITDTYLGGHLFAQERAGESLGYGRGGAEAVQEFTDALKNAATPAAKELADTFVKLGASGPISAGAAGRFGEMQFSMGTAFSANVAGLDRFLQSTPFLARTRQGYGSTEGLSRDQYGTISDLAALSGDYEGMNAALAHADASPGKSQYFKDKQFADKYQGNSFSAWRRLITDNLFYPSKGDALNAAVDRLGAGEKPGSLDSIAQAQKAEEEVYEKHQESLAGMALGGSRASAIVGTLQRSMIFGGGSGTLAAAIPGLRDSSSLIVSSANADIAAAQSGIDRLAGKSDKASIEARAMYQNVIAQSTAKVQAAMTAPDTVAQSSYYASEQEAIGRFQATQGGAALGIARGLYGGATYEQLHGRENTLFSGETAEAQRRRREAATSPYLHPEERSAYIAAAEGLEGDVMQGRYQQRMNIYGQRIAGTDLGVERGQTAVQRAEMFGGPGGVNKAYDQEISAFRDKVAELNKELAVGGLTASDRIAKERELTAASAGLTATIHAQAESFYSMTGAIQQAGVSGAYSSASIATLSGGTGTAVGAYGKAYSGLADQIATQQQRSTDPRLNEAERAQAAANVQALKLQQMQTQISETQFAAPPGLQTEEIRLRGSLERASRSFLEVGNVNEMRGRLFGTIGKEQALYEKQIADQFHGNVPAWARPGVAEQEERFKNERADVASQLDRSFFDKLPNMTIGATSFSQRYLPTYSQAAAATEKIAPTLSAYNFGYFRSGTYSQAAGEVGPLGTAGHDLNTLQPGNLSLTALAAAIVEGFKHVTISLPNGQRVPGSAVIQTNNARTAGIGANIPGAGGR